MAQFDPVLVNLVRRVYPQLIANSIIGVAPMTAPTVRILKMRRRYRYKKPRIRMSKALYKAFLRLNDRPKTQALQAFMDAVYPTAEVTWKALPTDTYEWCDANLGKDAWVEQAGTFAFKDDADAALFSMVWL